MLEQAITLRALGFAIHWLHPNSKRPIGNDWSEKPVLDTKGLRKSYQPGNNVGVRLGQWSRVSGYYLHIIDMDIRKPELLAEARARLAEVLPEFDADTAVTVISGSGGESRHFYILTDRPFPGKVIAKSEGMERVPEKRWNKKTQAMEDRLVEKNDWEIQLLGTGSQAVVPPSIHDKTGKPYVWAREFDTDDLDLGIADAIPATALARALEYDIERSSELVGNQEPMGLSPDEVAEILAESPNDNLSYDDWINIVGAVQFEAADKEPAEKAAYLKVLQEWSGTSDKHDADFTEEKFKKGFKNSGHRALITMRTYAAIAREAMYDRGVDSEFDEVDDFDDAESDFEDQPVEDMFDDILGSGPSEPTRKDSASQARLKREAVEHALNKDAPSWAKKLNKKHGVALVSGKTVILHFKSGGRVDYGSVSHLHDFYENERVAKDKTTVPITKPWMQSKYRRSYPEGIVFAPNREVEGAYNHWQGFSVEPSELKNPIDGCQLFLQHLREVVCNGNEEYYRYHLGWLAHMIQKPEEKPGVAVIYKGRKRIGKDTVFEYVGELFKNHYITVANQEQMLGKFNQHQEKCLLLHMQEGFWAGNKQAEGMLKYLITSSQVMIEPKGLNAFPITSVLRLFISSNERWVVPATADEGRFFVLEVSEAHRNDHPYFAAIRAERENGGTAALLAYLQNYDISDFQVRAVPDTDALAEQKDQSIKNVEKWWRETLQRGSIEGIQGDEGGIENEMWVRGPVRIEKNEFRESYSRWIRFKRFEGEEVGDIEFGIRMKKVCPSISGKQIRARGGRVMIYEFPSLDACRMDFETHMGSSYAWADNQQFVEVEYEAEDDL